VSELEKNRLDPTKPNTYISSTSTVNYEQTNYKEYDDHIGYNESLERQDVSKMFEYHHLPLSKCI